MTMLINDDKYGAGHFRKKYKTFFFSFNYYYPVNSYCMHPYLKRDNVKSNVTRRKKNLKILSTIQKSYHSRGCVDFSLEKENGNHECYELSAGSIMSP